MASVTFTPDGDDYTVRFDYDADVAAVLEDIPEFAREWRAASRSWLIFGGYARHLATELAAHGHTVIGITPNHRRGAGSQRNSATHNDYGGDGWAKVLFARVGPERADPVFKALTKVLHPDNADTGDSVLQRELNDARPETKDE